MAEDNKARKLVANNKKAYHDYFIEEKYEAGIELFGTEVKSIRQGRVIIGMSEDEVTLAMGEEPNEIVQGGNGKTDWIYYRSKGKSLFVHFGRNGRVESYNTGATTTKKSTGKGTAKAAQQRMKNGTPIED